MASQDDSDAEALHGRHLAASRRSLPLAQVQHCRRLQEQHRHGRDQRFGRPERRDGHTVADVALFYPARDIMRLYRPQTNVWQDKGTPVRELQCVFDAAAKSLYADGRCFMIVDEETLEHATVGGDDQTFRDLRWKAIVLPAVTTLSPKASAVLGAFAAAGGTEIRAGACAPTVGDLCHLPYPRDRIHWREVLVGQDML